MNKFPFTMLEPAIVHQYKVSLVDENYYLKYLEKMKRKLKNREFDAFETFSINLNYEVNFACSSFFSISHDMDGNLIQNTYDLNNKFLPGLSGNIIPKNGKTNIILSFEKGISNKIYYPLFDQLKNATIELLTKYLSFIVINHTDNIYFKISWIDGLDKKIYKSILESFECSMFPLKKTN